MNLPISLLVLVALGQALCVQPVTKRSKGKSSVAKTSEAQNSVTEQTDDNQTSKRELYEGNFGERNKEPASKYEVTGPPPKIVYAKELQEMISEQSPSHQNFGVRLPQIAKISDVLSGHSPSFEAAVAKHLYSPISVYHARVASPTSFEVPVPAASQSAYTNPKAYKIQKSSDNEQKLQEVPPEAGELPNPLVPLYTVNQPRLRFASYPQPLDSGLSRQHEPLPQEIFRPQQVPRKLMPSLFPIYDQLGPFRYPGQVVPSQYLHQNGLYQIVNVRPDFNFADREENRDKNDPHQENQQQLKAERPQLQINIPMPKQGYHAHPNGAISFASFTQNVPFTAQYETSPQPQSETFRQPHPAQLQSQPIPVQLPPQIRPEVMLQSQEPKLAPVQQKLQFPPLFHRLIHDLEKYQPDKYQPPQFIPFKQQIQNRPRALNALQKHLLFQDPRQLSNPQVIQLQRLPSFKPLPQSLRSPEAFLQQTSRSPLMSEQSPRPFSYKDQSTQPLEQYDIQLEQVSTELTSLPPLKPNYSKYVKPLEPHSHTTPVFLPTPLQPLPTSTPKEQPISDQLISSTTIQPNVKGQEDPEIKSIPDETQPQSPSQPLKPEIIHQSQPTVQPPSIQSTTYLPFITNEPQSIYFQYSTPQPQYQPTIQSQSILTSPRHDVVIQQQEIQELFFEPSPQPSSTPQYQNQRTQVTPQQERAEHQLRTQEHHQLFEQLQPLPYKQEIQELNSQQYQIEARQSQSPQKLDSSQQGEPQQYLIQQHSHPLQIHQFQPKLLQSQQFELEQSQQQQQESSQAQQPQQGPEQAQQHSLESNNQIQISTLKPSQDLEKQTEPVDIQPLPESQPQLQEQPKLQPTTGKPNEQPEHISDPTPNLEQPYIGPLLTPSVLPQIYAHPQQLVSQPEYSTPLGVPSYSDVQYFGKYAETLFGNHKHFEK